MRMIQSSMLLVFVLLSFVSSSWSLGKMFSITNEKEVLIVSPNPVLPTRPVVLRIECKEAQDLGHSYPQGMYCVKFDESGITLTFTFEDCKSEPTTPPSTLVMIRCGEQAGGALCPDDLCCSSGGYCGRTLDHCGEGCQSQCKKTPPLPQVEIRCGVQAKGASCPDGLCCSKDGYCGVNHIHCGEGCQDQCDPLREEYTCGEKDGVKTVCPDGLCCSKFGTCGVTPAYCGEGCQSQCLPKIPPPSYKPKCGVQAGGALCPDGLCCSKWGYCGLTSPYCYDGCQSQCKKILPLVKPRLEIRCGVQAGGALCPDGLCCSKNGYCGVNSAHCGEGCQAQCDPSRKEYTCGVKDGVRTLCPDGLCCSKFGTCGVTPAYCGQDCQNQCFPKMPPPLFKPKCGVQAGGALCPDGLCCSKWGHCGSTPAYCSEGCQSQCTIIEKPLPKKPLPPSEIRCGRQGKGALCSDGLCCSLFGYCGATDAHCCEGCQSQCYGEGSDTSRAYCRENDIEIDCITKCKVESPPRVITF